MKGNQRGSVGSLSDVQTDSCLGFAEVIKLVVLSVGCLLAVCWFSVGSRCCQSVGCLPVKGRNVYNSAHDLKDWMLHTSTLKRIGINILPELLSSRVSSVGRVSVECR
jgi:hypothetical protein